MRRRAGGCCVGMFALAVFVAAAPPSAAPGFEATGRVCAAAPVTADANGTLWVSAGPFRGGVTRYDVVGGGFALRVGELRTAGLSQKIPWFIESGTAVGATLVITGRTLSIPKRTF